MTQQCKKCGSNAFNLHWDGIDQIDLCDRHYWQDRAENPPRSAIAQSIHDYALSRKSIRNMPTAEERICIALCGMLDSIYFGRNDNSTQSRVFCLIVAEALS
jgi:hypothetical protein